MSLGAINNTYLMCIVRDANNTWENRKLHCKNKWLRCSTVVLLANHKPGSAGFVTLACRYNVRLSAAQRYHYGNRNCMLAGHRRAASEAVRYNNTTVNSIIGLQLIAHTYMDMSRALSCQRLAALRCAAYAQLACGRYHMTIWHDYSKLIMYMYMYVSYR